ncbi:hypothetical protein DFJ73DRAFT_575739 [Zopfochytrium polystomum]|nr:hypothetical protein DFJ73DRAFT_575739 [Zopfochytrium polystomum]
MSSVSSSNLPKVGQVLSPAAKSSQTLMMAWTARWAMLDVLRCLRQHIGGYSQRPYLIQTSFIEKLARQVLKMLGRLTKCAASSDSECQEELLKVYMAIYHDFCCLTLLTVKWTTVSTNFERTLGVTDLSMMSSPLILLRYSANPIWRLGIRRQSLRSSASIICRFIADHLRRVHALFNPIELADTAECLDDYNSLMACSKFLSAVSDILRQSSSNRDNLDEGFLNLDEASSLKLADWCLTAGAIRAPALARMFLLPFIEQIASNSKNQKNCGRILKRLCSDSLIPRAYEDSDRMSLARCIVKWLIRMSCSHFTKCDTTESEFSRPQRCEIELRQFCIMQLCAIDHGSLEAFNCLVSLLDDSDVSIRDSTSAALATQCLNHEPFLVSHCKEDGKTQSKRVRHHSDGACTVEEEVIFSSEGRVVLLDSRRNPYKLLIQYLGQFRQSERHCIGNNREAKAVGQWAFHITLHIFVTCPFLAGREAILGKSTLLPQILDPKFKFITKLVAELLNIYQELQTKRTNLAKSFDSNSKSKLDGLLRITLCISKILAGVLSGSISDLSNEIPRAHPRVLRIAAPLLSTLRNDPSMSVRLEVLSVCAKLVGLDHFAANSNHVEMRKVTDLEGLTLVYNVVRQGSVSGYSDSHSNARVGDLEPRVVKLLGLILDFGRKWHLDAVYPQVLKFAHPETYSDSSQSWPNRVARAREREVGAFTTELQSLERNPFRQRITSIGGVRRAQMLKRLEKEEADVMQAFEGKRSSSILTVRPNMHQIKRSHTKSHFDDELDPVITIPAEILHEESIKVNDLMAKHSNDAEIFRDSALHFEATLESATSSTARVGRQKSGDFILNLDSNVPGDDASISFDILVREQQHQVELIERLSAKMVERSQRTSAFSRSLNEETRRTQQLNYSKIRPRGLSVDAQVRYRQYSMDPMENNFRQVDSPALTNGLPDGIQSTDSIEAAPLHGGQTDSHGGSDPADYVWTPIVFDMDQGATMSGIQTKRATESKLPSLLAEEIPRHPALVNLTPPEEGCNSLVARREVEDVRRIKSVVNAETSITPTRFAVPQTGVALPERVRSGQLESPKLSRPDGMSETSTSIHCFGLRNADDLAATATQESPAPVDRSTAAGSKANCRSTMDLSTSAASPPPTAERQIEGFQPPLSSASKLQIPVLESGVSYPENQSHHFHREGTMSLDELDCKTTPKMDLDAFLAGIQMATVPAVHSRDPRFNLNMKETTDSSKTVTSHVDSQSAFVTPIKPIPGAAYTKYTGASAFNCSTSSDSLSEIAKTPGSPHSFVWTEEATSYRDATRTELHPESLLDEAPLMVGTSNKRRHSPVEVDKGQEAQQSEGLKSLEDHNQRAPVGEAERFETEDVSFGNGPSQVLSQLQLGGPSSTSINTSSVSASYMPSLIRPRVRSALELVLRHLVFFSAPNSRLQKFQTPNNSPSRLSKNLTTYQQHSGVSDEGGSIDYFDLYGSIGLAYGKLAFEVRAGSVSREDFSPTNEREYDERVKSRLSRRPGSSVYLKETSAEGLEALHPMLRNVFKLDMSLLTDFCQELDFSEEVNRGFSNKKLPLKDRLNLWYCLKVSQLCIAIFNPCRECWSVLSGK